jgi:hypothetical protein
VLVSAADVDVVAAVDGGVVVVEAVVAAAAAVEAVSAAAACENLHWSNGRSCGQRYKTFFFVTDEVELVFMPGKP